MMLAELNRNCHRVKPAATATVPASPHQAAHSGSRRGARSSAGAAPGSARGQAAGTWRSPEARAMATGTAMSSTGAGKNAPASSNGRPTSNQAMTRIAGSTVILAKPAPPAAT